MGWSRSHTSPKPPNSNHQSEGSGILPRTFVIICEKNVGPPRGEGLQKRVANVVTTGGKKTWVKFSFPRIGGLDWWFGCWDLYVKARGSNPQTTHPNQQFRAS